MTCTTFLITWHSVLIIWLAFSMRHHKFPAYLILFMKIEEKFEGKLCRISQSYLKIRWNVCYGYLVRFIHNTQWFFLFLTTYFHYKWLQISNRIPFQIKDTNYSYLNSCPTHTQCKAGSKKIGPNQDFSFLTTHFHCKRLKISNRIPFQIKHIHYSYLHSCLTHTQCEVLNARLPSFLVSDSNYCNTKHVSGSWRVSHK